jgi:malate synthase
MVLCQDPSLTLLYLFHNGHSLGKGTGPYYYFCPLESHYEAALWNDVFVAAQQYLVFPLVPFTGSPLETITAAFQMEEILYQLRDHLGLNWSLGLPLFHSLKKFKTQPDKIVPTVLI